MAGRRDHEHGGSCRASMRKDRDHDYPDTPASAESGRTMVRGEKDVSIEIDGKKFPYKRPGWWCSLADPDDMEGRLTDEDDQIADTMRRNARALERGETVFLPIVIRAVRQACGLAQREAGTLFGTGDKSFEKYEGGEIKPVPTGQTAPVPCDEAAGPVPEAGQVGDIVRSGCRAGTHDRPQGRPRRHLCAAARIPAAA